MDSRTHIAPAPRLGTGTLTGAAALGAVLIGVTLWLWGQPLICACGYVKLWEGSIFSKHTSQHVADWYTVGHVVSDMLVVLVGRWVGSGFRSLLAITIVIGTGWEIVEHTERVMRQFRATALYSDYAGDSVLNAVADYLWMLGGFALAWQLRQLWVAVLIVALEAVSALVAAIAWRCRP